MQNRRNPTAYILELPPVLCETTNIQLVSNNHDYASRAFMLWVLTHILKGHFTLAIMRMPYWKPKKYATFIGWTHENMYYNLYDTEYLHIQVSFFIEQQYCTSWLDFAP